VFVDLHIRLTTIQQCRHVNRQKYEINTIVLDKVDLFQRFAIAELLAPECQIAAHTHMDQKWKAYLGHYCPSV